MKKYFLWIFSILTMSSVAQVNLKYEVLDPNRAGKIFRNSLSEKSKPKGSPYLQQMFAGAKVENVSQKTFMRYNVYNDEFEFMTAKNDTLILDKIEDFSPIIFAGTNKKYKLVAYTNSTGKLFNGYLIDCYKKSGFVLLKKENITYYEERIAKTSLEINLPSKYVKSEDTFFLKNQEHGISEFPETKKQLLKLFPEKKQVIEAFLKEHKISFSEDSDRIRIVDLLATL